MTFQPIGLKPRRIDAQAGGRLFPQLVEPLPPWTDGKWIIKMQCAARLVELKSSNRVLVVYEDMRIGKVAEIVGRLAYFDQMREPGKELN